MVATNPRSAAPARRPAPRVRPAAQPKRPALKVVDAPGRRLGAIGVLGAGLLFGLLFGLVIFHTVLVQNQQHLDKLQTQIRDAQAQYQAQRLQVAQLESPARIVDEATARLGMVTPPGTTYLTPSQAAAAEVGGVPQQATGAGQTDDDWPAVKPYLSEQR